MPPRSSKGDSADGQAQTPVVKFTFTAQGELAEKVTRAAKYHGFEDAESMLRYLVMTVAEGVPEQPASPKRRRPKKSSE